MKKGINKIIRMKKIILYIIILFGFASCETWYEKLIGNYYLLAIDSMSEMRVSYYDKGMDLDVSITENGIYEVGHDEHFILAKAYKTLIDSLGNSLHRYNTDITEYYIILVDDTQNGLEAQENCFKLTTKEEFEAKRKELGVSMQIQLRSAGVSMKYHQKVACNLRW